MSYTQKTRKGFEKEGCSNIFKNNEQGVLSAGSIQGLHISKIKRTIYFAHPFDKWLTPRETRIEEILSDREYKVINPFKEEDKLNEKYGVNNYYEDPTLDFATDIVNKDWVMVKNCAEYFGWFPKGVSMIGTPIELIWAFILGKRITVLCYKPQPFLWKFCDVFYVNYKNFVEDEPFYVCDNKKDQDIFRQKLISQSIR